MRLALVVLLLVGCRDHANPSEVAHAPEAQPTGTAALDAAVVAQATPAIDAATPAPPAPPAREPGYDFIDDVRVLYRVVACGGTGPLPDALTHGDADRTAKLQKVVDKHCKALQPYMDKFHAEYFDKARAWLVEREPKDLPATVVYPFGGGDVISTLYAFPDATEITTISLELAGDPRPIQALSPDELDKNLYGFRKDIGALIGAGTNSSVNLSDQQRNALAAQLSSHLLGLATGGYEPVSVRYFTIADDGSIRYLEKEDIDADTKTGKAIRGNMKTPAFAQSFANVEVRYRKIGDTLIRTHRHIAWSLANEDLKKHPALLAYLDAKGKVAICVKGAVYLLWQDEFSTIRTYIVDHLAWMLSDSTGLPPNIATPAGFVQDVYGHFDAPIIDNVVGSRADSATRKLWSNAKDKAPFRFGYLDRVGHNHIMITRPK